MLGIIQVISVSCLFSKCIGELTVLVNPDVINLLTSSSLNVSNTIYEYINMHKYMTIHSVYTI